MASRDMETGQVASRAVPVPGPTAAIGISGDSGGHDRSEYSGGHGGSGDSGGHGGSGDSGVGMGIVKVLTVLLLLSILLIDPVL